MLPTNHRIVWPDADIQDLAYTLRDGVLLCYIANTVDPAAVDMRMVNQRPQMAQFLCLKNIRIFLGACTSVFGLRETDLFQPGMLYDYSDFARVLHTLSKLSNCPKAKARGIQGFPQGTSAAGAGLADDGAAALSQDEEQIYRTLEELVNDDKYEEFYYRHHGAATATYGTAGSFGRKSSKYYTAADQEEVEIMLSPVILICDNFNKLFSR